MLCCIANTTPGGGDKNKTKRREKFRMLEKGKEEN